MKGYPTSWTRWLYLCMALLLVSGAALLPTFLDLQLEMDMPWRASTDQRLWIVAMHTGSALLFSMLFGGLWAIHMRAGLRRKRLRVSGLTMVVATAVLTLSCLGIFYAGSEALSLWSSAVHIIAGSLAAPIFLAHRIAASQHNRRLHRQATVQPTSAGAREGARAAFMTQTTATHTHAQTETFH